MNCPRQKHIDNIMNNFRFDKVWRTMQHLDWVWALDTLRVPNVDDLRKVATKLLQQVEEGGMLSTGGFEVTFIDDVLELRFVVEDWYSDTTI